MRELLESTIESVEPRCPDHATRARAHIERLTMPHWALGRLLDLGVELAAMTRSLQPPVERKAVFVLAADHGVTAEGISLYPREVTAQMIHNFIQGGAAINVLSRQAGVKTLIVDMGVDADLSEYARSGHLLDRKISRGSRNFAREAAMSHDEAIRALESGIALALDHASEVDVFATGDMGIGNTTSSAAIAAALTGHPVEALAGRGTGIGDSRLIHKIQVIESALEFHKLKHPGTRLGTPTHLKLDDVMDILEKVGGFEIAAIAGLILGAARLKKPIVVDGYISTAGALLAHALCPTSMDYVIASHVSAEKGHRLMWESLGKTPLLDLGMRLGEGTGAVLAMHLIEASRRILTEMATFESAAVSGKLSS